MTEITPHDMQRYVAFDLDGAPEKQQEILRLLDDPESFPSRFLKGMDEEVSQVCDWPSEHQPESNQRGVHDDQQAATPLNVETPKWNKRTANYWLVTAVMIVAAFLGGLWISKSETVQPNEPDFFVTEVSIRPRQRLSAGGSVVSIDANGVHQVAVGGDFSVVFKCPRKGVATVAELIGSKVLIREYEVEPQETVRHGPVIKGRDPLLIVLVIAKHSSRDILQSLKDAKLARNADSIEGYLLRKLKERGDTWSLCAAAEIDSSANPDE